MFLETFVGLKLGWNFFLAGIQKYRGGRGVRLLGQNTTETDFFFESFALLNLIIRTGVFVRTVLAKHNILIISRYVPFFQISVITT